MDETEQASVESRLAVVQGSFDVVTGLWPIVHLRSFELVTGPKLEGWLVKTVGALITVIGGTLLSAGLRRRVTPEIRLLGMGSAAAFTLVDVIYTSKRRISPVYLLDAVVEAGLIAGWGVAFARSRMKGVSAP
ncbi:MAG TPA: hypothetical protein VF815_13975 [Myxococcaceae bacterium]|jgi:hypothetical protein